MDDKDYIAEADGVEAAVAREHARWKGRLADAIEAGDVEEREPRMSGAAAYAALTPAGKELLQRARKWQSGMRQRLGQADRLRRIQQQTEGGGMDYDSIANGAAREASDDGDDGADGDGHQGAYVQAWVWVESGGAGRPPTDDEFREAARQQWSWGGEIEIDDDARVSRDGPEGGGEPSTDLPSAISQRATLAGADDDTLAGVWRSNFPDEGQPQDRGETIDRIISRRLDAGLVA